MVHGILAGVILLCMGLNNAFAGVALGATRVIYPAGKKQVQLALTNNDNNSTYLIQSWVENTQGQKYSKFVITPPLFVMQGKKENTLRIIDLTNNLLPQDRESIFWLNVKAIPAMDKSNLSENTLQLAIVSRIKLYYRPTALTIAPEEAPGKLSFHLHGTSLTLNNPTPYYLTVTEIKAGTHPIENALVPPMGNTSVNFPSGASHSITYRTINDYGALTPLLKSVLQ
ncbi:fimbria/pilus periplasmic chaperone [Salmonella enterica]|nr:fimbria/pilus periplasmic chaperone [Salmonella enterica]EHC5972847.1 fimbria/pilus periplasmic chaperone [Salmonella enterica]EIU9581939.1 fimbria/pilus periplasmic chaperone [Salmonella enterica]ELC1719969.1 fimbria/pilus periplasmic chaperone [Salmonella enterica]